MVARPQHVELAGGRYRVLSDLSPAELSALAQLVNDRVSSLGPRVTQTAAPAHILAVVALELAQDLQTLQRDYATLLRKVSAQLEPLLADTEDEKRSAGTTLTNTHAVAGTEVGVSERASLRSPSALRLATLQTPDRSQ